MSNASQGPFVTTPGVGRGQGRSNLPAFGIGLSTISDPSVVKSSILEAIRIFRPPFPLVWSVTRLSEKP